jgi:hypothetical protein
MPFQEIIIHSVLDNWQMLPEPGKDQNIRRVAVTDEDSSR